MKQVLRKGFADIVVEEVPDPVLIPHHVIVRPHYSLISSGTETASIHQEGVLKEVADNPSHLKKVWDVLKVNGPTGTFAELKARFSSYAILGYSGAGVIAEKHPSVTSVQVGDRVAYGGEGTGHGEAILAGENLVAKVPEKVSLEHATFTTLGSIAMNAVRVAQISVGDSVAVIGLGLVGQLVAQLVRVAGGVPIGVDLMQDRVDLAGKLGTDVLVPSGASVKEAVLAATGGRGADCVIVAAAAKSAAPVQLGLSICRDRGRLVIVGAVEVSLPWLEAYLKETQILFSRAYGPGSYDPLYEGKGIDYPLPYVRWTEQRNMSEFLRLCSTGAVNVEPLISHRFKLEQASSAYKTIMDPAVKSLAVVLSYPAASNATPVELKRRVEVAAAAEPKSGNLNFALIGAGNIAKWAHMPSLRKLEGVALKAVQSGNGARSRGYAERFGAQYCASDYAEILNDKSIDAVLITNRNQRHAKDAVSALEASKHVFVEKPMALTEQECRDLFIASKTSGKQVFVGFNRRFAPLYLELKKAASKRKGPMVINCRVNSPGISGGYWMADPEIGGAILGEACHFVDLFYWLTGSELVEVFAYSLPTGVKEPVGENNMAASFKFADGSVANLTYCTVGSKTSGGERVEIYAGGIGAICEDFRKFSLLGGTSSNKSFLFAQKGYDEQMADFVGAIRSGGPASVTVVDGARSTLGCLKMLESAKSGQPCAIELASVLS